MKKGNLMAIGVAVCMLSACGSSEDVDAVAANMLAGGGKIESEKDAKCVAKSLKKNASDDQWNKLVSEANGEKSEDIDFENLEESLENLDKAMEEAFAMLVPYAIAAEECGVPFGQ